MLLFDFYLAQTNWEQLGNTFLDYAIWYWAKQEEGKDDDDDDDDERRQDSLEASGRGNSNSSEAWHTYINPLSIHLLCLAKSSFLFFLFPFSPLILLAPKNQHA